MLKREFLATFVKSPRAASANNSARKPNQNLMSAMEFQTGTILGTQPTMTSEVQSFPRNKKPTNALMAQALLDAKKQPTQTLNEALSHL